MPNSYDFDVAITCRHDECHESFKTYAIEEVKKLSKYHSKILNGDIRLDKQNPTMKVEIALHVPGSIILAAEEDQSYEKAFDSTYEKVKIQLKKIRSKETDHRPISAITTQEADVAEADSE